MAENNHRNASEIADWAIVENSTGEVEPRLLRLARAHIQQRGTIKKQTEVIRKVRNLLQLATDNIEYPLP